MRGHSTDSDTVPDTNTSSTHVEGEVPPVEAPVAIWPPARAAVAQLLRRTSASARCRGAGELRGLGSKWRREKGRVGREGRRERRRARAERETVCALGGGAWAQGSAPREHGDGARLRCARRAQLPDVARLRWLGRRPLLGASVLEVDGHLVPPRLPLALEKRRQIRDVVPNLCHYVLITEEEASSAVKQKSLEPFPAALVSST
mmetsp:Transcript_46774/g.101600  ORF Transcript_46774/g.101600 Transcript_46774/m.101600 type:complete len:204 (-) Transcript_46774:217-828(-)